LVRESAQASVLRFREDAGNQPGSITDGLFGGFSPAGAQRKIVENDRTKRKTM
jgi:hypothetical protein